MLHYKKVLGYSDEDMKKVQSSRRSKRFVKIFLNIVLFSILAYFYFNNGMLKKDKNPFLKLWIMVETLLFAQEFFVFEYLEGVEIFKA
jgi:hypothetical protein